MPLYEIKCLVCQREEEIFRRLVDYQNRPICCGQVMTNKLSAPFVHEDIKPYRSQLTGEMISSRVRHRNHLKEHNCIEIGNEVQKPQQHATSAKEKALLRRDIAQRLDAAR